MEDDAFHRTIIALERLESFLNQVNGRNANPLLQTATGSSRDHHRDDSASSEEMCFLELSIDCSGLFLCSDYKDPEIFLISVEAFLFDLLQWYGGRSLLDFYDSVDAMIIPITAALSHTTKDIDALFEKYVYKTTGLEDDPIDEKENAVKEGMNSWIKAQDVINREIQNPSKYPDSNLITSHKRGTAIEGYKRIIAALTNLFHESTPLKMFVKIINKYLPDIANQLPSLTEESVELMYSGESVYDAIQNNTMPKIDLFGLEEVSLHLESENQPSQKEVIDNPMSNEEKYARILKLTNEIINLVNSLKNNQ